MITSRIKSLRQSSFVRSVSVLVGGTAFAQLLALLALPVLTRLYSPEEFGLLAVFVALLTILSVVAALRYEIAIPIPEKDEDAINLLALALATVVFIAALIGIVVLCFSGRIAELLKNPVLADYLWLLPIGVLVTGAYSAFQFWATRMKAFPLIARTRLEQAIGGVLTQLGMGWAGFGALGLIVGQVISTGAGFVSLVRGSLKSNGSLSRNVSFPAMKSVAATYSRYPKYSTVEALMDAASIQVPLLIIAGFAVSAEVGFLMLTMRVMQAPLSLIGSAVSQVYFARGVEEYRQGRLGAFTALTVTRLGMLGVGPLIFAGMIAPSAASFAFGSDWERVGVLIAWMTPSFIFQMLASPVSMSLHITGSQRTALVLQTSGLLFRVLVVIGTAVIVNSSVSEAYAISGMVFNFAYLMVVFRVCQVKCKEIIAGILRIAPFATAWVFVGLIFLWLV